MYFPRIFSAAALLAFAGVGRAQTTYAWVGTATNNVWTTDASWSPATGFPGTNAGDTADGPATSGATGGANINTNPYTFAALNSGAAAWSIYNNSQGTGSLTIGTINQIGAGDAVTIRDTSASQIVNLTATNINISAGALNLGAAGTSTQHRQLNQLNGVAAVSLSSGTLSLNLLSDYSLGTVTADIASGATTPSITLINNSDGTTFTRNVTLAGLSAASAGSATLSIYGAGGSSGGAATLNFVNGGTQNYAANAILADNPGGTGSTTGRLALGVNLTGTGTQTLTGASTFSGGTTIGAGTLYVSNTTAPAGSGLGAGQVTVAVGATLGGTGTIGPNAGNNVTINGTLEPGDLGQTASGAFTPGTLTFDLAGASQLSFDSGSVLALTVGSAPSYINFSTPGNWLGGSGNWTLALTAGGGFPTGAPYKVFANASTASFAPGTVTLGGQAVPAADCVFSSDGAGNYWVAIGPTITTQPSSLGGVNAGQQAQFAVAANGTGTLGYQWYFNGVALANGTQADNSAVSGATLATLTLTNLGVAESGAYTCNVTDSIGMTTSSAATLAVSQSPTITNQPVTTSANAGGSTGFSVSASGGTLTYQWYLNGTALNNGTQTDGTVVSGATSASLTLTGVHGADAGSYTVVVTDTGGPTTSSAATLTVNEPPAFTVQPVSVGLAAGQTASFYAPATGAGTVTYQWYLSSTAITNATDAYLLVTPVSSANAGSYTCIATNAAGSTTSTAATLTLSASTDLGRLTNVSVRTNCGTGSANIIAGFVLGGAGNTGSSKSMLIRAVGPELANFGVPGFLPDPSLDVFNTTDSPAESVGQNTGWCVPTSNEAPVVAAENAVYAFALTTNSASSAIVLDLPPDQYTENVTGASGDTGIALAEIYDVTNATETYSAALPRLINVSARANVAASGAGNLIAGFTIGGSTDKTVLVRGTGPGLAEFSLTGLLAQPTLAVYSTASGDALVASNTGWDFDPVLASTAAGLYAFGQTSSADCCLLVTLPPGTYTANLDSNNAASGLALVEVYEVP